jgi:hypothetical protein
MIFVAPIGSASLDARAAIAAPLILSEAHFQIALRQVCDLSGGAASDWRTSCKTPCLLEGTWFDFGRLGSLQQVSNLFFSGKEMLSPNSNDD